MSASAKNDQQQNNHQFHSILHANFSMSNNFETVARYKASFLLAYKNAVKMFFFFEAAILHYNIIFCII